MNMCLLYIPFCAAWWVSWWVWKAINVYVLEHSYGKEEQTEALSNKNVKENIVMVYFSWEVIYILIKVYASAVP